jgi:hypothetical protein
MYPYINRSDCYYTDTDSVVLTQPLPNEVVGSELGKFKLEYKAAGTAAPKSNCLILDEDREIKVLKGEVKRHVTRDWYKAPYEDLSLKDHQSLPCIKEKHDNT